MHLFEPEELEALVCGGTDLDFGALQQAAKYEDGFEETSEVRPLSLSWKRLSPATDAPDQASPSGAGKGVMNPCNVQHALALFIGLRLGLAAASSTGGS